MGSLEAVRDRRAPPLPVLALALATGSGLLAMVAVAVGFGAGVGVGRAVSGDCGDADLDAGLFDGLRPL